MKKHVIALLCACVAHFAHAETPTAASVERLLQVTRVEALLEAMYGNVEQSMRNGMMQAAAGRPMSAEQQKVIDIAPRKFIAVLRQEMGWSVMQPMYVQIYRESLSQEEVDGLINFYQSELGQVLINKMPAIMERSMALSQTHLKNLLPKMQAAMGEAMREAGLSK